MIYTLAMFVLRVAIAFVGGTAVGRLMFLIAADFINRLPESLVLPEIRHPRPDEREESAWEADLSMLSRFSGVAAAVCSGQWIVNFTAVDLAKCILLTGIGLPIISTVLALAASILGNLLSVMREFAPRRGGFFSMIARGIKFLWSSAWGLFWWLSSFTWIDSCYRYVRPLPDDVRSR